MRKDIRADILNQDNQMPAPDLLSLFDLRTVIEENSRNSLLALGFPRVFTRKNGVADLQKDRPRLELKALIGAQNRHVFLCPDGHERHDQWGFNIVIQLVSEPSNNPETNVGHTQFQGQLRNCMSTFAQGTWDDATNWPYHAIAEALMQTGEDDINRADDGVEFSTITFSGVVAIRSSAWPQ